jgi:hypothetical protein
VKNLKILTVGVVFFALTLASAVTFAQSSAKKHLAYFPEETRFLFGVDLAGARGTTLYDAGAKWVAAQPDAQFLEKGLVEKAGIDPQKDLHRLTFGFVAPDARGDAVFTAVIEGEFDKKDWGELVEDDSTMSQKKVGELDVFTFDDAGEVALPKKNIAVFVFGPAEYRKKVWKTVRGKAKTVETQAMMKELLGKVDLDKHVWVAMDVGVYNRGGPVDAMKLTGALDASKGVQLEGQLDTGDKATADMLLERWKEERTTAVLTMQMMRGEALMSNLKLEQDKGALNFETSMTDEQLEAMLAQLEKISQKQEQGAAPAAPTSEAVEAQASPTK